MISHQLSPAAGEDCACAVCATKPPSCRGLLTALAAGAAFRRFLG